MDVPCIEMPRYECHKEVHALKIKSIEQSPCAFPIALTTCGDLADRRQHSGSLDPIVPPAGRHDYDGSVTITPEDARYAPFVVDPKYVIKHAPQPGGYYVVYADGYQSFSPAEAFESGYTLLSGRGSSEFEIIADTTASILMWFDKNPEYIGTETAQIEIGHRVKSAIKRSTT